MVSIYITEYTLHNIQFKKGEKKSMVEFSFKRNEDELWHQLKLELQRKMILAQKQWARTKI